MTHTHTWANPCIISSILSQRHLRPTSQNYLVAPLNSKYLWSHRRERFTLVSIVRGAVGAPVPARASIRGRFGWWAASGAAAAMEGRAAGWTSSGLLVPSIWTPSLKS